MTAEECRALGEGLSQNLLLRYSPIAMKLLYDVSEIPAESLRPLKDRGEHLAMCQAYAAVRRDRVCLAMLKEDHWCVWPLVSYGLVDLDADDYEYMGDKFFFRDKERSRRFLREEYPFLKAEKKPIGFALAPLEKANFVPDLVTVYCNPAQIRAILMGTKFMTGEMFRVTLDPVDSCVHSSIPVLNGQDYNITFPDPGEYERGLTDEDEVMFTLRGEKLAEVAEGVGIISRAGFGYKQLSMEMTKNFPRPEFYNKMFEKWGLDTGPLWRK
jgi:uncharacterized protein (DUF169 family)